VEVVKRIKNALGYWVWFTLITLPPEPYRMPQALSLETPETLTMGDLRDRLLGFDKDEYTGRYVLRVRVLG
jgi:hypothetical protein